MDNRYPPDSGFSTPEGLNKSINTPLQSVN